MVFFLRNIQIWYVQKTLTSRGWSETRKNLLNSSAVHGSCLLHATHRRSQATSFSDNYDIRGVCLTAQGTVPSPEKNQGNGTAATGYSSENVMLSPSTSMVTTFEVAVLFWTSVISNINMNVPSPMSISLNSYFFPRVKVSTSTS